MESMKLPKPVVLCLVAGVLIATQAQSCTQTAHQVQKAAHEAQQKLGKAEKKLRKLSHKAGRKGR